MPPLQLVDQWLTIKDFLTPLFNIKESLSWSLLPSEKLYCRSALLGGVTPAQIDRERPDLWEQLTNENSYRDAEQELLKFNFYRNGIKDVDDLKIEYIHSINQSEALFQNVDELEKNKCIVMVVEFAELLMTLREESDLLREIAPDEAGFKQLT